MPEGENNSGHLSRRDAIKVIGAGLATCLLQPGTAVASGGSGGSTSMAMLYDATKCVGCRSCVEACNTNRGQSLPEQDCDPCDPCDLTPYQWTVIKKYHISACTASILPVCPFVLCRPCRSWTADPSSTILRRVSVAATVW